MATLINIAKVLVLTLILAFTVYTYKSQQALTRETSLLFTQSQRYTDGRIIDIQSKILGAVSDVSEATKLLALIICKEEKNHDLCYDSLRELNHENAVPQHYPTVRPIRSWLSVSV
jgi:hypothetical protein